MNFVMEHWRGDFPDGIDYYKKQVPTEKGFKQRCEKCGNWVEQIFACGRESKVAPSYRDFFCKECADKWFKEITEK